MELYELSIKVYQMFTDEEFLNNGSFEKVIDSPEIKTAINELIFELMRQDVTQRGPIKKQVEKVVDLIRFNAYQLAETL